MDARSSQGKIINMIKKEQTTKTINVNHKYCDDCGVEIKMSMSCSVAKCEMCGKDLCDKCIGHEEDNTGDYRVVYCSNCWNIGTEYRNKIKFLEKEIEQLELEWNEKCKQHIKISNGDKHFS
jgi:hypothetical protein